MQRRLFVVAHPRVRRMSLMRFETTPLARPLGKYKGHQLAIRFDPHSFALLLVLVGLTLPNTIILQDRTMNERQGFQTLCKLRVLIRFWEQTAKTEKEESSELQLASNTSGIVMGPYVLP